MPQYLEKIRPEERLTALNEGLHDFVFYEVVDEPLPLVGCEFSGVGFAGAI
jgi:hypothetical protein